MLRSSIIALFATAISLALAAPTSRAVGDPLSCNINTFHNGLTAGDYYYGSGVIKVGVQSSTESGEQVYELVKIAQDDTTTPQLNVTLAQCNSTYLGYYSQPHTFGSDTPVKLIATDYTFDEQRVCLGIDNTAATPDRPAKIVLQTCSSVDDASQADQFWQQEFKYANLLPLVNSKTWPINNQQVDAAPQPYTTGPFNCSGSCDAETVYASFSL